MRRTRWPPNGGVSVLEAAGRLKDCFGDVLIAESRGTTGKKKKIAACEQELWLDPFGAEFESALEGDSTRQQ